MAAARAGKSGGDEIPANRNIAADILSNAVIPLTRWCINAEDMSLPILQLLLLSAFAVPGLPATAGQDNTAASDLPQTPPGADEVAKTIDRYRKLVSADESSRGVYDQRLGEDLLGLGLALAEAGENRLALDALRRSLHITRINQGLESPAQLPILEQLIKQNMAVRDWDAVEQNYAYLYWVNRRSLGNMSPELLPVLRRLGQWHLSAEYLDSTTPVNEHLIRAAAAFQHMIRIIDAAPQRADTELISALKRVAEVSYRVYLQSMDFTGSSQRFGFSPKDPEPLSFPTSQTYVPQGDSLNSVIDQRVPRYRQGKAALQRVVDIYAANPDLPRTDYALAMAQLGDWYLLFDKRNSAMERYRNAFAILLQTGLEPDKANRLFAQPVRLPALDQPALAVPEPTDISETGYVLAEFDLSRYGRPQNIRIKTAEPPTDSLRRRGRRYIRKERFRPRIENGMTVRAENVTVKYRFRER